MKTVIRRHFLLWVVCCISNVVGGTAHPRTNSKPQSKSDTATEVSGHTIVPNDATPWQRAKAVVDSGSQQLSSSTRNQTALGPDGDAATKMLNYKTKNANSNGESGSQKNYNTNRGSSAVMSLFASMTPKQGQLFSQDRSFPQSGQDASAAPPPSSPTTRLQATSLSASASSPHQPLPPRLVASDPCHKGPCQAEETTEEQDKYPCLRRALSCTETPILPLGTYAVEFGFDVSTLPFMPNRRTEIGRRIAGPAVLPRSTGPASFVTQSYARRDGYQRVEATSHKSKLAKSNCDNRMGGSTSLEKPSDHAEWQTSLARIGPCYSRTGYAPGSKSLSSAAATTTMDSVPPEEQFNVFRQVQGQFLADETESKWGLSRGSITSVVSPLTRPSSEWTEGSVLKSRTSLAAEPVSGTWPEESKRTNSSDEQSRVHGFGSPDVRQECSTHSRNYPSDVLYATVWKKDNRTWLWKSRKGKRLASEAQRQYIVAKTWKKDNRTWLWKSRSRN